MRCRNDKGGIARCPWGFGGAEATIQAQPLRTAVAQQGPLNWSPFSRRRGRDRRPRARWTPPADPSSSAAEAPGGPCARLRCPDQYTGIAESQHAEEEEQCPRRSPGSRAAVRLHIGPRCWRATWHCVVAASHPSVARSRPGNRPNGAGAGAGGRLGGLRWGARPHVVRWW